MEPVLTMLSDNFGLDPRDAGMKGLGWGFEFGRQESLNPKP